jgi:hypothetical protein
MELKTPSYYSFQKTMFPVPYFKSDCNAVGMCGFPMGWSEMYEDPEQQTSKILKHNM